MVSSSQLQVAKLAQICPAAPNGTQQRTAGQNLGRSKLEYVKTRVDQNPTRGAQRRPTALNGADQYFFIAHHPF